MYNPLKFLSLEQFKEMDYFAVENYNLPIELMMENAGYHLTKQISRRFDFLTAFALSKLLE